jgi:photosystem II stability/assembly factor-like uncharacterized protein
MQKPVRFFMIASLLAGMLAACNLPNTSMVTPTAVVEQPLATQASLPAAKTELLPTETLPPPTSTSIPPTVTPTPGPAVMLDQIHMLNVNEGWGWASRAGEMNQLLRTSDGGQTWLDVSPPGSLDPKTGQAKYSYYDSFFLNPQAAWLVFYDSSSSVGGMLHTSDGGQTWVTLPPNDILQNAKVTFTSPSEGVAETAGLGAGNAYLNYYQTQDGGATWKIIALTAPSPETGLPTGTIHLCNICGDSLYYDPARVIITYGDMASDPVGVVRLSVSTDLGQKWTSLQLPLPDKYTSGSVAPLSPTFFGQVGLMPVNIIKYNTDGSLGFSVLIMYTSQDGGKSWQAAQGLLENQPSQINTVQVLSVKDVFVRCGKNLCSSSDGAQTWRTLPDNSLNFGQDANPPDYVSQFSFVDPSNGWAISGESGATTLWRSKDGGATWIKTSPTLVR